MKNGVLFFLLLVIGVCVGSDMFVAGHGMKSDGESASLYEQQIDELIIKLAEMDMSNLDKIAVTLRGDWEIMPASLGRVDGWITHEAKVIAEPSWLERAQYIAYVERDHSDGNRLLSSSLELRISLRDKVCFSGKSFMQPKYNRKHAGNWISFDPQPTDGGGTQLSFLLRVVMSALDIRSVVIAFGTLLFMECERQEVQRGKSA